MPPYLARETLFCRTEDTVSVRELPSGKSRKYIFLVTLSGFVSYKRVINPEYNGCKDVSTSSTKGGLITGSLPKRQPRRS